MILFLLKLSDIINYFPSIQAIFLLIKFILMNMETHITTCSINLYIRPLLMNGCI